ncbi:MAG: prepilin-type N-terminal cleavage/methylation domain-containing protein [Candidatus Saccharimonadales bacterium]
MSDNSQRGFTITELALAVAVSSILFIAFMTVITDYFILITRNNVSIDLTTSSQNLLRYTVDTLRVSNGVRQTNTIADPNSPPGGWNTSNSDFVIVISTPATDNSHNYIIDPNSGFPYLNELVYYKSGTSLYRRDLANPSATGNSLMTSCPAALASPSCPADVDMADNFQSMSFTLYDQNGAVTTDTTQARSIAINLNMQRSVFGNIISLNNSIRVALRNKFS